MIKRQSIFVAILSLCLSIFSIPVNAAVKAGGACTNAGSTSVVSGKTFTCIKSGKKLVWNTGTSVMKPIPARNSATAAAVATYPKTISILPNCSATNSCPAPTSVKINLQEGCHSKVKATLQKEVMNKWVDVAQATGWSAASECSGAQRYRPFTVASIAIGTEIRWRVYASGQWEWFSSPYDYTLEVPTSAAALAVRGAIDKLASEPVSTFKPTSACQLVDQITPKRSYGTDLSAGFPKVRTRIKSYGNVKALIVPVDFTDIVGKDNPVTFFTPIAQGVNTYFNTISYGRVAFDFTILPKYVHMDFPISKFKMGNTINTGDVDGYLNAVIHLTNPLINYADYEAVYFLVPKEMPMALMGWGPAITSPKKVDGGYIINGATGGADMYLNEQNGVKGATWKWMAHETGHAYGWYDEDYKHESQTLGSWGVMSNNWSNEVIEQNAWDRYLQGWLEESQVGCTSKTSLATAKEFTINALSLNNGEQKSVMIPLSGSKILVAESRRASTLDNFRETKEGLLVYTVDMTIGQLGGGYVTIPRPGSTDKDNFLDAALQQGDSVTVGGVTITVTKSGANSDTISVSKK